MFQRVGCRPFPPASLELACRQMNDKWPIHCSSRDKAKVSLCAKAPHIFLDFVREKHTSCVPWPQPESVQKSKLVLSIKVRAPGLALGDAQSEPLQVLINLKKQIMQR